MIKISNFFWLFFCVIIFSCGSGNEELIIPDNVIDKENFSSIIVEVLILEGYKSRGINKRDSVEIIMSSFYKDLFEKFDADKEKYDRSYLFYSQHPELMEEIF